MLNLKSKVRMASSLWQRLNDHLNRNDGNEHLAFVLASPECRGAHGLEFLCHECDLIDDIDLEFGPRPDYLELKSHRLVQIVNRAIETGSVLIEVHNHPGAYGSCKFSVADHHGFNSMVPYMLASLPTSHYGALVIDDHGGLDGLTWCSADAHQSMVSQLDIVNPYRFERIVVADDAPSIDTGPNDAISEVYDRQIRAFGPDGQARIGQVSVGIVGLGGIGSIVAELLARLGVSHFTLVDPDIVEFSNLNRLLGATTADVESRTSKVGAARRNIENANHQATVTEVFATVFDEAAIEALSSVDLIVGGTDDSASRFAVNDISLAFLRPYMDLGTEIFASSSKLQGLGGRHTFLVPGEGCILCSRAIDAREASAEFVPKPVKESQIRAGYISGGFEPSPSVMNLNAIVASHAVFELQMWMTGIRSPVKQQFFDGMNGSVSAVEFNRNMNCLKCNHLLGRGSLGQLKEKYRSSA